MTELLAQLEGTGFVTVLGKLLEAWEGRCVCQAEKVFR
jgi:hypothetical protein